MARLFSESRRRVDESEESITLLCRLVKTAGVTNPMTECIEVLEERSTATKAR